MFNINERHDEFLGKCIKLRLLHLYL